MTMTTISTAIPNQSLRACVRRTLTAVAAGDGEPARPTSLSDSGPPSPPTLERPARPGGVAYPDQAGRSGCANPQHRSAGNRRRQRLEPDASRSADHLHGHSPGDKHLDRTPRLQVQV